MKAKEYLSQGIQAREMHSSLIRQIRYCDSQIGNLKSTDFSREYTTGSRDHSNSRDGKLILLREECRYRLRELSDLIDDYEDQVAECFSRMPESRNKEALYHYHCLGETQREIARLWGYDSRQIRRYLEYGYRDFPMPKTPVIFAP